MLATFLVVGKGWQHTRWLLVCLLLVSKEWVSDLAVHQHLH